MALAALDPLAGVIADVTAVTSRLNALTVQNGRRWPHENKGRDGAHTVDPAMDCTGESFFQEGRAVALSAYLVIENQLIPT